MEEEVVPNKTSESVSILIRVDHTLVSVEALLKTCYWFSRDFVCNVVHESSDRSTVHLRPKNPSIVNAEKVEEQFLSHAMDFALRERIAERTSGVRDLLLAKAFSESGVLEEEPHGVFGDAIEESKPDGMFKILSNG